MCKSLPPPWLGVGGECYNHSLSRFYQLIRNSFSWTMLYGKLRSAYDPL